MGNMAAFFATKKAKELAAIAQHPVEHVLLAIEATEPQGTGDPCPKCGRALSRQGRHLHIRRCVVP